MLAFTVLTPVVSSSEEAVRGQAYFRRLTGLAHQGASSECTDHPGTMLSFWQDVLTTPIASASRCTSRRSSASGHQS